MKLIKIQRFLQRQGTKITFASAIFIVTGLLFKYLGGAFNVLGSDVLLGLATFIAGLPIMIRAYSALKAKVISIELLVSIAVIGAVIIGEYNESAIVTFLFLFGDYLEQKTLAKTRSSIKSLAAMAPTVALLIDESGQTTEVDVDDVELDDHILVKPGAQIPVDGEVISGHGFVDEAAITGESREIGKEIGDQVFSGAVLTNGFLTLRATKVGEDTTFAKIIELVEDAQDTKSKTEKFIDQFARYYTPAVLLIALIVFVISRDLKLAITVLVLGCPGALVIGAPVSNVAGIGNGAKHGVLVKGAAVMDEFQKIKTFYFDKTGTLTTGKTSVTKFITTNQEDERLLETIYAIESLSDHPLARAVVADIEPKINKQAVPEVLQNQVVQGQGIIATLSTGKFLLGNEKLAVANKIKITKEQAKQILAIKETGSSLVLVMNETKILAIIGISDEIKPGAREQLAKLRQAGAQKLVMLTGDNEITAQYVACELGLDEVQADLLPEQKAAVIQDAKKVGAKVAFIGDGINDSPSLATADIGIAMGSGTDVAIETSDVVLMQSGLNQLVYAYQLAQKTVHNTRTNIVIAIGVVVFLLIGLFAGFIYMASGMFVHEASILVVILNAMRLLQLKPTKN